MGRSDPTGTDDKVVFLGHPPGSLDDFLLVIGNDLDPLELDTQVETLLGEKVAVRIAVTVRDNPF